ncbi:MAG: cysteine hydrolase family protein [Pirellulaceae bacterium]
MVNDDVLQMTAGNERVALLIIDVQAGIFTIPGFQLHDPDGFLSRVARLIDHARAADVPVVYVQHNGGPGSPVELGAEGCEIHSSIAPQSGDLVVRKEESDAFLRTELQQQLQRLGVTTLVVCGMQSEYCVDTTCRSAYGLGYKVFLVEDAHTTGGSGSLSGEQIVAHHNETLDGAFVTLCRTADVFSNRVD